jgi:hypothetical protein
MAFTPKPMSGSELGARIFVIEALVIALAKDAKALPPDLMDRVRKQVASFNRPELVAFTEQYIEEISKELGTIDLPQDSRTAIDGAKGK